MANQNIGDQINRIVTDALDSMDFHKLNRDINATVKSALSEAKESLYKATGEEELEEMGPLYREEAADPFAHARAGFKPPRDVSEDTIPVPRKPAGAVSGIVMMVTGILGSVVFGLSALGNWIVGSVVGFSFTAPVITLGVLTLISGGVIAGGVSLRKRVKRFREYLRIMSGYEFYDVGDLAAHCRTDEKYIRKDLKKMIKGRMFLEGHLDDTGQWFIGNHKMYAEYLDARDRYEARKIREEEERRMMETEGATERQLRITLERGRSYLKEISQTNDMIRGEEITAKVEYLEIIIEKIFARVKEKPVLLPETRKFIEYYLPTTAKLVGAYKDFEDQPVQGENILAAKKEIEKTLDTIGEAFEKLLESLFDDTAMDISTDISVLKSMLARDGLTAGDFKGGEK
ncbi:MAG: 5-bromo-4-chloroindolyl phosphate hydrolysis family protein [Anaerovoracaceae bacterium]|jgi:5-bromo-4-chloroindolyl phosphate hydrolysis protein